VAGGHGGGLRHAGLPLHHRRVRRARLQGISIYTRVTTNCSHYCHYKMGERITDILANGESYPAVELSLRSKSDA
jgi:hypothetical protein